MFGNLLLAQNPTIDPPRKWATTIGGVNFDLITDAVGDGVGGLYITGYSNSPNFPTTLPGNPGAGYDAFVAQLDSNGAVVWSTRYGGSGIDYGNAIALDAVGNLVVAGKLGGQGTFVTDSTYKGTGDDILVLKLSGTGSFISALRYGGTGADEAVGIATDAYNQLVVVGNSSSTDISTTSATYNGTSGDAFVLRLRSNLSRHLAFRYGGNSFDKANDAAIDASGNFYVAGETGSANFQQTIATYQGGGGAKAFVMRFDSLGVRSWSMRYGGNSVERAYALDLPVNGGLLVGGYTTSSDFPQTISGLGGAGSDAFLLHLNLDGSRDYARRLGGALDDQCNDLSSDADGNVFMAGETFSVDFPSTNNRYKGTGRDQFLAKFSPAGAYGWSIPFGGSSIEYGSGAIASSAASVYLTGHTQSLNYPQTLPGTGGNTARGAVLRLRDCIGQDADFDFQHVCEFDTVFFQNLSVRGSSDTVAYRWWFGDGDSSDVVTPWHYYAAPGAYQVMLRVTSPCGVDSTVTKTVNVYPAPRADWTHSNACFSRGTEFMDSTQLDTIVSSYEDAWTWDFGTGDSSTLQNPTYVFATAGSYMVHFTVETNHGCSDTASHTVVVHWRPNASFSFNDVCLRDTAIFDDNSNIGGDTLNGWAWDFGDGGSSSDQNPAYVYMAADTYAVSMIVTTNESCADTITQWIKVLPLPEVNFGMTAVCWPDTVAYTDSTSIVGDAIAGYQWHFGDAQMDTLQNTWHGYAASGSYDVVLWVFTASGCADSLQKELKVNDKPNANISFANVCWPETTQFIDSSSVQADSLVQWDWTFGDGATSVLQNPSNWYVVADTYAVSLAVVSGFGCSDTAWENVIVLPKPEAHFVPTNTCYPIAAVFQDGSTVSGDVMSQFGWDFGDSNSGTGSPVSHAYGAAGEFMVTLVAQTASGCKDTIQDTIWIYPQPEAAFEVENVCDGDTVWFADSSTVSSGTVDMYWYDFGNGQTSMLASPYWIYGSAGNYTVTHIVASNHQCLDTIQRSLTIHALPDPEPIVVGYADICIGDTVVLQETQAFPHYQWETGDTSTWISVQGRSDWVVLTVTDGNDCVNSDSVQVRYHNVPAPNPIVTPGPTVSACADDSLFLTAGGSYFSYNWSDGNTDGRRYIGVSGPIWVLVFNGFGCADTSDIAMVNILPLPATPIIHQVGNVLTVVGGTSYQWYKNGLQIINATASSYTVTGSGIYTVKVTGANGCSVFSNQVSMVVGTTPEFLADLSIYPNPFSSETNLMGNLEKGGSLEIRLVNAIGQVVLETKVAVSAGQFEYRLETAGLPAGYYSCELQLGKDVMRRGLVKQ